MPDFYHAPTCLCGQCFHEPDQAERTYVGLPCGCFFFDGEMEFCEIHLGEEEASFRADNT